MAMLPTPARLIVLSAACGAGLRTASPAWKDSGEKNSGDHLHLNPAGYQALAAAVPARLLRPVPLPQGFGFR